MVTTKIWSITRWKMGVTIGIKYLHFHNSTPEGPGEAKRTVKLHVSVDLSPMLKLDFNPLAWVIPSGILAVVDIQTEMKSVDSVLSKIAACKDLIF